MHLMLKLGYIFNVYFFKDIKGTYLKGITLAVVHLFLRQTPARNLANSDQRCYSFKIENKTSPDLQVVRTL
jgi:hypothetical protein